MLALVRLPVLLLSVVAVSCATPTPKQRRPSRVAASAQTGEVTYTDRLAEFLVEAGRVSRDPVAIAHGAWRGHEQQLGYLVKQTYFPHLDDVEREQQTGAVLDSWADGWPERLARMKRLQVTFRAIVDRGRRSFARAFGQLPVVEAHLVFVPDGRRYATAKVFNDRVLLLNAAVMGASDEVIGRVTLVQAFFESLREETGVAAPKTVGEALCVDALAARAVSVVYPAMEADSWVGVSIPPGVDPLRPALARVLPRVRDRWNEPDPDRSAAGAARPALVFELETGALDRTDDPARVLSMPLAGCVSAGRLLVAARAGS